MDITKGRRGHRLPDFLLPPSVAYVLSIQCAQIFLSLTIERKKGHSLSRQNVWLQFSTRKKLNSTVWHFFMKFLLSRETRVLETLRDCYNCDVTSVCLRRQDFYFSAFLSFSVGCPYEPLKVFFGAPASITPIIYHFSSLGGQLQCFLGILFLTSEIAHTVGSIKCINKRFHNV